MTRKEKIPASIPLAEFNKKIAQEYREKARHLLKCADIIEGKEPTNDNYDLLREFVEWYDDQVARDGNGRPIARVVASLDEWVEWFLEERG